MNGEKTTLPTLRNIEWIIVKKETKNKSSTILYFNE